MRASEERCRAEADAGARANARAIAERELAAAAEARSVAETATLQAHERRIAAEQKALALARERAGAKTRMQRLIGAARGIRREPGGRAVAAGGRGGVSLRFAPVTVLVLVGTAASLAWSLRTADTGLTISSRPAAAVRQERAAIAPAPAMRLSYEMATSPQPP